MLESPAKSSSSANDFKRYSCCPIPLVYHALFGARKMPIALVLGRKPVPIRLESRSLDHVKTKRPHTQIFVPLAFTDNSPPDFQSSGFDGGRLVSTKKADELVEFASS